MTRTIEYKVTETKETMLDAIYYEIPFFFKGRWYMATDDKLYSLSPEATSSTSERCGNDAFYFLECMEQLEENDIDVDLDEVIVLVSDNGACRIDWSMVDPYWETDDPDDWDMTEEPDEGLEDIEVPEWFGQILSVMDDLFEKSIEEFYK